MFTLLKINLNFKNVFFKGEIKWRNFLECSSFSFTKTNGFWIYFSHPLSSKSGLCKQRIYFSDVRDIEVPKNILLYIIVSSTGREIQPAVPKEHKSELLVCFRKKNHWKSRDPAISSSQNQSNPLDNELLNIPGTKSYITLHSSLSLAPVPNESSPHTPLDLDILIAIRKGICSCTNYPIAKYLDYVLWETLIRLSCKKFSHFVPRTFRNHLVILFGISCNGRDECS